PVIDNGRGLSGDPQIARIEDVWVMFYFGCGWKPKAFDTFACSYDLVHWTRWQGPHLIEPSEPWDQTYAHKPWVVKKDGIVYHYYCAVGDQGRVIALATSEDLRK
ncbi:MAG: glycosylase, partial [Phycisphaerae bacterium SG8_4]